MALSISRPTAVRRCKGVASSTRRTLAEQPDTFEPLIETAPLSLALTTPPVPCGCEERAG